MSTAHNFTSLLTDFNQILILNSGDHFKIIRYITQKQLLKKINKICIQYVKN
jgi:hypothetical protein